MFPSQYTALEQRVVLPAHRQFSQLCDAFVGRSPSGAWEVASDHADKRSDTASAEACAEGHFQTIVSQLKRGMGRGNLPILLVHVPGALLPSALRIWLATLQGRVTEADEPGAGGGGGASMPSRSLAPSAVGGASGALPPSVSIRSGGVAHPLGGPPAVRGISSAGARAGDTAVAEAAEGAEDAFVLFHDVGSSRHSTSVRLLLLRMLRLIGGAFGIPVPSDHSSSVPPEDWLAWRVSILLDTVSSLCQQSRDGGSDSDEGPLAGNDGGNKSVPFKTCIIVLTGVHALHSTLFEHLQWLLLAMPPHVKVILTAEVAVPDALALCPPPSALTQAGHGAPQDGFSDLFC
jgi:hypothetical protein